MTTITQGQALAFFAFDIGYEVALDQARQLLASTPAQPLSRKKPTPAYLQYTNAPEIVQWGEIAPLQQKAGGIQITLYDFGAVSILYRWPLQPHMPLDHLSTLSADLFRRGMVADARQRLHALLAKIRPAITRPEVSSLVEDYYVFVVERLDAPMSAHELLDGYGATLAQTLRLDTQPLSDEQQHDALNHHVSYYKNDLVLIDWNAAVIYDQDYDDALNIFELLNIELLEARYIDAQLDRRVGDYERLRQRRNEWPVPFRTPYRRDIEALAELRIESSLLSERVDNALKLIGDDYLARLHATASRRFYMHEWDAAISRKLNIVAELYQLLTDRVSAAQGQTLELVVIALIAIELWLAVVKR